MEKKDILTKTLAIFGTVLVLLPVLAPFILGFASLARDGKYHLDYLMPAELFLSALVGGPLLIWASMRAHSHRRLIGWGLLAAVLLLAGAQALATITGLASGETEPTNALIALVLTPILIYALMLAVVGVGGALLTRDLYRQAPRH
jgi:hypothetical protein